MPKYALAHHSEGDDITLKIIDHSSDHGYEVAKEWLEKELDIEFIEAEGGDPVEINVESDIDEFLANNDLGTFAIVKI